MGQAASNLTEALAMAQMIGDFKADDVDVMDAAKLPMEDGIWVIAIADGPGSDGFVVTPDMNEMSRHFRIMVVIEGDNGKVIGTSAMDEREITVQKQALDLFKTSLFSPMMWKPHRPRYFGFRNDVYFCTLPLEPLGICRISMNTGESGPDPLPQELELTRQCAHCRKRGSQELFDLCPACRGVYYCSPRCKKEDLVHARDMHGHQDWCERIREYVARTGEIADLPFSFCKDTSSSSFHEKKLKTFLADQGVLGHGYWRWEYFDTDMPGFGALPSQTHPVGLPLEGATLETEPADPAPGPLTSWSQYYDWRGFSMDSPVAVLLQWPLTVYRVLTEHLPEDYPDVAAVLESAEPFRIHLVGVEKEADMTGLFAELASLFPSTTFCITLVGSEISPSVHNKDVRCHPRVTVRLRRGVYHTSNMEAPHIVIGFNAGLAAYHSWVDTLKKLKTDNLPAYFTDYCQYSSDCARAPMEYLGLGGISPPALNPYRSPLRKYCEEHEMPWFSNAFIYRLVYS